MIGSVWHQRHESQYEGTTRFGIALVIPFLHMFQSVLHQILNLKHTSPFSSMCMCSSQNAGYSKPPLNCRNSCGKKKTTPWDFLQRALPRVGHTPENTTGARLALDFRIHVGWSIWLLSPHLGRSAGFFMGIHSW